MSSCTTLFHLVSDQRMQNLLPLLAIQPERVVQIRSKEARFEAVAKSIQKAAKTAGLEPEFLEIKLPDDLSDIDAVRHQLKRHISDFPNAIVNLTGGTKLMSLGAYLGASEFDGVPMLYCDSANKRFIQVGDSQLPASLPSVDDVAAKLTVPTVMAAHGKDEQDWKFDVATPSQIDFGNTAWNLRTQAPDAFKAFGEGLRNFFRTTKGRIPTKAGALEALAKADFTSAFSDALPQPVLDFLAAAVDAGFLQRHANGGFRPTEGPESAKALRQHLEKIANILDGSWLELAVLSFLQASPIFSDARWSVEPTQQGQAQAEYGETDVIAVNTHHCTLEVISCKTLLKQPLEHLEGLRTRATNLGGSHARASLALLNAGDQPKNHDLLRRWGKLLKVNVLIGSEIRSYFQSKS